MMSKGCYTNKEAQQLDQKELQDHLYLYYGSPNVDEQIELANTATLIRSGEVIYTDVAAAINDGWPPADMDINEWLEG